MNFKINDTSTQSAKLRAGVFFLLLSSLSFGIMSVFVRLAGDLPSTQKALYRNAVALIFAAFSLRKEKDLKPQLKGNYKDLLIRALAGTVGFVCNFYAIDHLPLGDANALAKLSPFFVILVSAIVLNEKIKSYQILGIVVAFIGTLFITKPSGFSAFFQGAGAIAVLGALGAGVAYTFVRKLGNNGVPRAAIVFAFGSVSVLILLPIYIFNYQPMTLRQFFFLILAGLAATAGQFSVTTAYSYAPGREISVFDYAQIPISALAAFFVFNELPDKYSFFGYFLILAAGVAVWKFNLEHHRREDLKQQKIADKA